MEKKKPIYISESELQNEKHHVNINLKEETKMGVWMIGVGSTEKKNF